MTPATTSATRSGRPWEATTPEVAGSELQHGHSDPVAGWSSSGLACAAGPWPKRALRERVDAPLATSAAVAYVVALPLLRPSGPFNTSPVDVPGLVLVLVVGIGWVRRRAPLRWPYSIAVAVFATGGLLGALGGPVPGSGLVAVLQDLVLLLVCACMAAVVAAAPARRRVVRAWAMSGLMWATLLICGELSHAAALGGGGGRYGSRATLTFGDPNLAGNYLVVSFFMLHIARWPARPGRRALATVAVVVAIFLTGSNGAVAAAMVATAVAGVAALCMKKRWRIGVGLAVLAGVAALAFVALPVGRWQQDLVTQAQASSVPIVRDSVGRQDQSSSTRHTLLDESIQLFRADGVLGTGPGSTKPRLEAEQYPYPKEAHDDYFAALIERGALGLLGLALLIGSGVRRLAGLARASARGAARVLSPAPMMGCAAALATSGMFYEVLHFRHVWVFLALLASAPRNDR